MVDTLMLRRRSPPVPHVSIDVDPRREVERNSVGDHGSDESGHLLDRLPLASEGDSETGDLSGSRFSGQHLAEDDLGLGRGE